MAKTTWLHTSAGRVGKRYCWILVCKDGGAELRWTVGECGAGSGRRTHRVLFVPVRFVARVENVGKGELTAVGRKSSSEEMPSARCCLFGNATA